MDLEADKMFEKLGYRKLQTIGNQQAAYTNYVGKQVIFNQFSFENRVSLYGTYQWLDMQELEAINKKCEELGWKK